MELSNNPHPKIGKRKIKDITIFNDNAKYSTNAVFGALLEQIYRFRHHDAGKLKIDRQPSNSSEMNNLHLINVSRHDISLTNAMISAIN